MATARVTGAIQTASPIACRCSRAGSPRLEVGVPQPDGRRSLLRAGKAGNDEREGDEERAERMGDARVTPVDEPMARPIDENVRSMDVRVIECLRHGGCGELLAHGGELRQVRKVRSSFGIADHRRADGGATIQELVEQLGDPVDPSIRSATRQPPMHLRRRGRLHVRVHREQPLQGSHLFGERQGVARRGAMIGEEHPRPFQIDRQHVGREARPSRRQIRDDHRLMTTERPSRLEEERPSRADGPQHRSPRSLLHALQPNDRTRALGDPALHLSQPHRSGIAQPRSASHTSEPGSNRARLQPSYVVACRSMAGGLGTTAGAVCERP